MFYISIFKDSTTSRKQLNQVDSMKLSHASLYDVMKNQNFYKRCRLILPRTNNDAFYNSKYP